MRGIFLNEIEPVLRVLAHQPLDQIGHYRPFFIFVRQGYADQRAGCGVHCRFAQLAGVHLAQAFEAANVDFLVFEYRRLQFGAVRVVGGVNALAAMGQAVERRAGKEQVTGADDFGHFLKEIGHQQRRDMRAVDVGVGHDDDAFIAQVVGVAVLADAAAQRQLQIGNFAIATDFFERGGCDVEDLAADWQYRLFLAVTRLLGAAARTVAFDDEQFGACRIVRRTIGELAGQANLAARRRSFAFDLALGFTTKPVIDLFEDEAHQRLTAFHIIGEEVVEMVAHRVFDEARCFRAGQSVLGLALELRIADEDREHQLGFVEDILCRNLHGFFLADQFAKRTQALGQRRADARLMCAAIRRRDGVAIPAV